MPVLSTSQLSLSYGNSQIFDDANVSIADKARIGLVGPNGAGKSSLIKVIVGEIHQTSGELHVSSGVRIGYVPQISEITSTGSLMDEIKTAFSELFDIEDLMATQLEEMSKLSGDDQSEAEVKYSDLVSRYEYLGGYTYENRLEQVVSGVGLSEQSLRSPSASASGGERTRAALAKAILYAPELLILDEPTNYLDLAGLDWLENMLSHYDTAFLVVSHDRHFLDKVASSIWELDHEKLQVFSGNYSQYRRQKGEQVLWQRKRFQRQQEFIAKEQSFIRRYGAGQRAAEAKGRARRLSRLERFEAPETSNEISLSGISASRTGQVLIQCNDLSVGFKEGAVNRSLIRIQDIKLERNSRTCIVGSNGVGKTTFLKTMLGMAEPLEGSVTIGHNVDFGYFSQESYAGPEEASVFEALLEAREMPLDEVRPYLARFLFRDDEVFKTVSSLSGGEKSRLALARLLINKPNLLVLDEPTTHLDIATREAMEQVFLAYDGTMLFVSHDRHLISLMAKNLWVLENNSITEFNGSFDEWQSKLQSQSIKPSNVGIDTRVRAGRDSSKNQSLIRLQQRQIDELEGQISDLEQKITQIEHAISQASETQNVVELTSLGKIYESLQVELAEKWDDLGG